MTRRPLSVLRIPTLPAAPGKSGFHIKGVVYSGIFGRLAQETGALERLREELNDQTLLGFFDQLFLASGWYDIFPIVPLFSAMARTRGVSFESASIEGTRARATEDLNSIYRSFYRGATPAQVALRLARGFGRYIDFGDATSTENADGTVEIATHKLPTFLLPWYMPSAATFCRIALELAGARDVRTFWRAPEDDGERGDISLASIQLSLSWR
ncbi:hypothetical protein [Chondromyces crocatus]|uniref:Heme NO-binding domain-containing protein n=1 Tax=Chondromyces crocatus TaxID=52 RepID=A0A0K1EDN3_CHOCO|nr:hypothetical protein [Chondromyces crocatus]AKT38673.1 uncharacterized protein CMC5_028210 [Chondromyces crocatus]